MSRVGGGGEYAHQGGDPGSEAVVPIARGQQVAAAVVGVVGDDAAPQLVSQVSAVRRSRSTPAASPRLVPKSSAKRTVAAFAE